MIWVILSPFFSLSLTDAVEADQGSADEADVEEGAHHRQQQDRPQVLREGSVSQGVGGVQDDAKKWRQTMCQGGKSSRRICWTLFEGSSRI